MVVAHNAGVVVVVVVVVREKNADLQEGRKSDKREMTDTRYRFLSEIWRFQVYELQVVQVEINGNTKYLLVAK
jgi:hypothetical protein